jgi:hypothetical protein
MTLSGSLVFLERISSIAAFPHTVIDEMRSDNKYTARKAARNTAARRGKCLACGRIETR